MPKQLLDSYPSSYSTIEYVCSATGNKSLKLEKKNPSGVNGPKNSILGILPLLKMFCKSWPVQSCKEWKLLPSLPPRVEKPWLNAAAIFADMFALVEAAAAADAAAGGGGMLEGWLEEKRWGASSKQSSSASTHAPCTKNQGIILTQLCMCKSCSGVFG